MTIKMNLTNTLIYYYIYNNTASDIMYAIRRNYHKTCNISNDIIEKADSSLQNDKKLAAEKP